MQITGAATASLASLGGGPGRDGEREKEGRTRSASFGIVTYRQLERAGGGVMCNGGVGLTDDGVWAPFFLLIKPLFPLPGGGWSSRIAVGR